MFILYCPMMDGKSEIFSQSLLIWNTMEVLGPKVQASWIPQTSLLLNIHTYRFNSPRFHLQRFCIGMRWSPEFFFFGSLNMLMGFMHWPHFEKLSIYWIRFWNWPPLCAGKHNHSSPMTTKSHERTLGKLGKHALKMNLETVF